MKAKKIVITLGILLLLMSLFGSISAYNTPSSQYYLYSTTSSINAGLKGQIYLIVNSTIHSAINSSLQQYIEDAEVTGYNVTVLSWSSTNVTALRETLQNAYSNYGIIGAVLIGKLPYLTYYLPAATIDTYSSYPEEYFPCDLYLMDLNGTWNYNTIPTAPKPAYDNHTGHVAPEIWVSRIDPEPLVGENGIQLLIDYFSRNHLYKNGTISRAHRALVYIDDDWANVANEWNTDMQRAYSNTTLIYTPYTLTNDTDYELRLNENYEWIWAFSHCNGTHQGFGSGIWGFEGFTNYSEIKSINPKAFFYNLYACHGTDYSQNNNIGIQYLFSNNGLMVIGSTKTGALNWGEDFYNGLRQNRTFGDSLVTWFTNSPRGATGSNGDYYSYGVNLLGDPLLTIHHDVTCFPPIVSSTTHPDNSLTYEETTATFSWTVPQDISGIAGYYVLLNQNTNTNPISGGTWTTDTIKSYSNLTSGTYYFHISAKDLAGAISEPTSFIINVADTTSSTTTTSSATGFEFFSVLITAIVLLNLYRRRR